MHFTGPNPQCTSAALCNAPCHYARSLVRIKSHQLSPVPNVFFHISNAPEHHPLPTIISISTTTFRKQNLLAKLLTLATLRAVDSNTKRALPTRPTLVSDQFATSKSIRNCRSCCCCLCCCCCCYCCCRSDGSHSSHCCKWSSCTVDVDGHRLKIM